LPFGILAWYVCLTYFLHGSCHDLSYRS
jgi:hypothetical protein